jgi:hypothetical protein
MESSIRNKFWLVAQKKFGCYVLKDMNIRQVYCIVDTALIVLFAIPDDKRHLLNKHSFIT